VGNWKVIIELIKKELLCDPSQMVTLCPECHEREGFILEHTYTS
jgi:5-methylcytosine-specific restriction endonuclease McrA